MGASFTYLFATILYWGNIPTCCNSTICCKSTLYIYCYNMLQHLQICSIVSLQYRSIAKLQQCKNFNHLVHALSGLSGREQALWAKHMHVMADWGVMRPICCVTSVPPPSTVKVLHTRSRYVCLTEMATLPNPDVVRLFCLLQDCCAISMLWIFVLNSKAICFQLTCFGTLHAQQSLVVSITSWTSF